MGTPSTAEVDSAGRLVFPEGRCVEWWIGADDRWRYPGREVAVRQHLEGNAPVVVTAMRVPGGDAVHTVYATGSSVVIEIHNDSPAPFLGALVLSVAGTVANGPVKGSVRVDDTSLLVGGAVAARFAHAPSAVTTADSLDALRADVAAGVAPGVSSEVWNHVAALVPVAHRARVRVTVPLEAEGTPTDPRHVDDVGAVVRGWERQRSTGLRTDIPDPTVAALTHAARCELLLSGTMPRPAPELVAALEDWGHDDEAVTGWAQLGFRGRGRARRRPWNDATPEALAVELHRLTGEASPVATWSEGPASFLLVLRAILGREARDGSLELLAAFPPSWAGGDLDVHDLPTRSGPLSYALRWHGENPALLWEGADGLRLRVPGIDPTWETTEPSGEALLVMDAEHPIRLGSAEAQGGDGAGGERHG